MERRSKVLQERTAPGGAGFVQHNIGDNPIVQPDGFHILSANVQDKRSILHIFPCSPGMGYCLYHMALCLKGFRKKHLTVAGSSRCDNVQCYPFFLIFVSHGNQGVLGHQKRISFIWRIKGIQDIFFFVHEYKLRSGASRVNAKIGMKGLSLLELGGFYLRKLMPAFKFSPLFWRIKKRLSFLFHRKFLFMFNLSQAFFQFPDLINLLFVLKHSI